MDAGCRDVWARLPCPLVARPQHAQGHAPCPARRRRTGWWRYGLATTTMTSACRWTRCARLGCPVHTAGAAEGRGILQRLPRPWLTFRPHLHAQILAGTAEKMKNFAVIYLVDISEVPDFNAMYELYDPCTVMFFFRNKVSRRAAAAEGHGLWWRAWEYESCAAWVRGWARPSRAACRTTCEDNYPVASGSPLLGRRTAWQRGSLLAR